MSKPEVESVHVAYWMPLSKALAALGLPEGDEYDIAISRVDGDMVLQVSVSRVPEPGQEITDVVAGLGITPT